uniref:NLR family apoptosis inhibitory protein n=1 Tax=Varanus komodoensis TaxID=61221 RepID=A0A8D2KSF8_VARKO
MATQETSEEGPGSDIFELDPAYLKASNLNLNFDFHMMAEEMEEEYRKIRKQLQRGFNSTMRSEAKRLKTFLSTPPDNFNSTWAPSEMATNGFYHTGVKTAIQCFCCGLVLLARSFRRSPHESHKKYSPHCEFILGKEVGNIPKFEVRVQNPENSPSEVTKGYKEVEKRLDSFTGWPFYVGEVQPALLADAGFFFTGIKDTVQCFACAGSLGNWEEGDDPWKEHAKWFPKCEFLQQKKSSDEIKEYIQNYCGFVGVTSLSCAIFSFEPVGASEPNLNIYEEEGLRMESFETWPQEAHADPTTLAKFGFFYTGEKDIVQCFSCGGRLVNWEETDDPWTEHAKVFPQQPYIKHILKTSFDVTKQKQNPGAWKDLILTNQSFEITLALFLHCPFIVVAFDEHEELQKKLRGAYDDIKFRKMFSFGNSSQFAIDLKLLFGDLSITSKNINNLPLQLLVLPEVFETFHSITVLEGEAGSGKTALLRKTAILWASGCCPIVSRFKFVFYLSLSCRERDQSLAELICNQVVGLKGLLTEDSLKNICQQLTNEVLFLLDDYDEMNAAPRVIQDLILKNYLNKHCLVIAVRTNRVGEIRQYASAILSIEEFPLTSTLFLLRKLFSQNAAFLERVLVQLSSDSTMHSILKTPLFAVALAKYWTQSPNGSMTIDTIILKAYVLYSSLKYPQKSDHFKTVLSACGELALQGLFKSCFEFSKEDLSEVGVNGDDALWFGLLSKFTAQRLWPLYKFFHLSFQEFLAGLRMSELLGSDVQEDVEKGLQYLQQINTFVKITGRYQYVLRYACSSPVKAVLKIISHLLSLLSGKESCEWCSENDAYLQQASALQLMQQQLAIAYFSLYPKQYHIQFTEILLKLATELAYQSDMVSACAPMLLQFLSGKELYLDLFDSDKKFIHRFFLDYPESLYLPSRFKKIIFGKEEHSDLSIPETSYSKLGVPVVNKEHASAFKHMNDFIQKRNEHVDLCNSVRGLYLRHLPDPLIAPFLQRKYHKKVPHLTFKAVCVHSFPPQDLQNLTALFSAFDHIKLNLHHCGSLIESIKPAIEQNLGSFRICSISSTDLSAVEENLLLSLSSLESLKVKGKMLIPETLFVNLDKYAFLKELIVDLCDAQFIFDIIPEDFKNLHKIEKLLIYNVQFKSSCPRLVEFIQNFQNLSVFHLKNSDFSALGALMEALSSCKMLTEIQLTGLPFGDEDLFSLAAALPNLTGLKVLDLERLNFINKEASEALNSLVNLEELSLTIGEGISHKSKLIVQQCSHFPNLRKLELNECLNDEALLEIAKIADDGGFQNLEFLLLRTNHNITEEAWRNFFQILSNMPKLHKVDFFRIFTHQIKCQAATVKSFVQCVSRLPSLSIISMIGWLFDEEDLKMFDIMKKHHPQSNRLELTWKWTWPVSPIINE